MNCPHRWHLAVVLAVAAGLLSACGGGSSGPGPASTGVSPLVLIDMSVGNDDGVALNTIIKFEFSVDLDPDTVRPDTIRVREGPNYGKQVPGYFKTDGNIVRFYPRLPVMADVSDAGFQPGKKYRVTLPGSPDVATVRSYLNDRLTKQTEVVFTTALAGSTSLFIDNFEDPLPPQVQFVNPPDGAANVPGDAKLTLTFNRRPLSPATVTSANVKLTMIKRRGVDLSRPVSGTPKLAQTHDSVTVEFVPTYPLADQATYRLEVSRRVQDLVGNDIEPFSSTFSIGDQPPRFSSIELTFDQSEKDTLNDATVTTASWNESEPDALAALFTVAGGNGTAGDLLPKSNVNLRPYNFQRGVDTVVEDGIQYDVYNFREINIPQGVSVRFSPSSAAANHPVKIFSLKPIQIDGTIYVNGGAGQGGVQSNTSNSKLIFEPGGTNGPGGGAGADTYNGTKERDGAPPADGGDVTYGGGGGHGGTASNGSYYIYIGGGGGGGGSYTSGKDGGDAGSSYSDWNGKGGKGGLSAEARGYPANLARTPNVGGGGGGAGHMGGYTIYGWRNAGGSGGGGGGAITIQGAGSIRIGSTGAVLANGGDGGAASTGYSGGGGGGGGGGSVLLRATSTLTLDAAAEIDVSGGKGGAFTWTYTYYGNSNVGGNGGGGYIRLEAREDENSPGKPLISGQTNAKLLGTTAITTGLFAPKGGGAPSVGQTLWMNLGVFDPSMIRPKDGTDIIKTIYNDQVTIEVQMAVEDQTNLGHPDLNALDVTDSNKNGQTDDSLDLSRLSNWTLLQDIESLNGNGYQYIRVRITFQLDSTQTPDQPLPFIDFLRLPFKF